MTDIIENVSMEQTPIQKFYSGTNIFITGATGFLGRILVEKLLRSCPDLSTIYILVRSKKGKTAFDRLDELFEDVIFNRLREEQPKFRHKVVAVPGDCCLPDLGLNIQDRQMLINEVNLVFHVAATVRFDEKLKLAVAINVRGVQDMVKLCKEMSKLKCFIHVSTAFVHCHLDLVEEKFYPPPMEYKKLITLADITTESILDKITPTILDKFPNSYAYTKSVGEDVVNTEGVGLPFGIFRPSIIISTYKEPVNAWINNLYGPTGVVAGALTGLLHSINCNPKLNANVIPADMCVNFLISMAWEVHKKFYENDKEKAPEIPIYQYDSSEDRPLSWGSFVNMCYKNGKSYPSVKAIWYYYLTLQPTYIGHFLAILFLHYIPAFVCDSVLVCWGKGAKLTKVYKKIHKFTVVIAYFSTKNFKFRSTNMRNLLGKMTEKDQKLFFCDLKKLDWEEYFRDYIIGIRLYLINDPLETLEVARIRWKKLYYLHQTLKLVVLFIVVRILWAIFSTIF